MKALGVLLTACVILSGCTEEEKASTDVTVDDTESDTSSSGIDVTCQPELRCDNTDHTPWYDLAHCEMASSACYEESECDVTVACSPKLCPLGGDVLEGDTCPADAGCYTVSNGWQPWTCVVGIPCALGDEVAENGCPADATCYDAQGEGAMVTCIDNGRATCGEDAIIVGGCQENRFPGGCREETSESGDVALCEM